MSNPCFLLEYSPDPNPNISREKDTYKVWKDGNVKAETEFYVDSEKGYETRSVEFDVGSETVDNYLDRIEEGLSEKYFEGCQLHVQISDRLGEPNGMANISRETEPESIAEVRRELGRKGRDELGLSQAFNLE